MSISSQVERIKGHTLGEPEKAFIITASERDPKEVKYNAIIYVSIAIVYVVVISFPILGGACMP